LTVHLRSLVIDNASADTDTDDGGYVDGAHRNNYYDLSKWVIDLYSNLAKVEAYGLRFGTVCGASPNLRTDVPGPPDPPEPGSSIVTISGISLYCD